MYAARRHVRPLRGWEREFAKAGFAVDSHAAYLSDLFVKFHNIGTRTNSKYMIRAVNRLGARERGRMKRAMVRDTLPIIRSYLEYESGAGRPNCFHMFCLRQGRGPPGRRGSGRAAA